MTLTILITGVAGLIGNNFVRWLLENIKNIKIIGIDSLEGGYKEYVCHDIDFYKFDLLDYTLVEYIFKKYKIDLIYHFAAYAAEGLSPFIRKYNYNNNLLCTTNLVNMSIKYNIKRFIFTSSMAVYGKGKAPFSEENKPNPIDPYGVAKYAAEMDIQIAGQQHGLDWCIIRPHNVYGKYQNIWDIYRNVLGIWMYQTINKQKITIYGDGKQKRAFTYVDDIMRPLWNAGIFKKCSKQIINLGGIEDHSINEAANIFCKHIDNDRVYLEKRHEVKYAYSTFEKSVNLLEFKHQTSLEDGILKMWKWAKEQPNRERKKWKEFEIDKKIYEYWK